MELNDGLLDKVRALLAKAEATPFDAEAEAFTNKAQELIARYRIDRALLDRANARERESPILRRVGVETPYVRAKYVLLSRIAEANHCQTVWLVPLPVVDVFGLAEDLVVVEELFTSLLLQVTTAMRRAGAKPHDCVSPRLSSFIRRSHRSTIAGDRRCDRRRRDGGNRRRARSHLQRTSGSGPGTRP
jgi:hypothetical protein